PNIGNGIAGVDSEVDQDLIDLGRIHLHRPWARCRVPLQGNVFSYQAPQHRQSFRYGLVQVQRAWSGVLPASKDQQLTGQLRGTLGSFSYFLNAFVGGVPGHKSLGDQIRLTENDRQHVVEIVGDAAGEASDRLQFLRLLKLGLQTLAVGDVHNSRNEAGDASYLYQLSVVANGPHFPALRAGLHFHILDRLAFSQETENLLPVCLVRA